MENQYVCRFDIDFRLGDIEIKLNGDGQEVLFKFMIAFCSFPSLLFFLLQLWNGKMNKTEISSFGFAVKYYFTVEDEDLLIEHSTFPDGEPITRNYKFNFEKFAKALDKGFSEYLQRADALSTAESNILSIVKGKKDKTSLESETLARHTLI